MSDMISWDEGGLGLGLEWARCPKCREEGIWENDVFECCACFGTFRRTKRAAELGDSAASQALSTFKDLSTQQAESTPAPIR